MCADEGVGVRTPGDELVSGPRPKNVSAVFLRTEVGVSQIGPQSHPITQCWAALRGTLIRILVTLAEAGWTRVWTHPTPSQAGATR
jgi:hypothetical protein